MKLKAFLQALILCALLLAGWFALYYKWTQEQNKEDDTPSETSQTHKSDPPSAIRDSPSAIRDSPSDIRHSPSSPPPSEWQDWYDYLAETDSPAAMRRALQELAQALRAEGEESAAASIAQFLDSGADLPTGFTFTTGPEGHLRSAPSLRVFLLDQLGQIAPEAAARRAEDQFSRPLPEAAGEMALHMRNFVRGSSREPGEQKSVLKSQMERILDHPPYLQDPTGGLAESMDAVVYAEATSLTPKLAELMDPGRSPILNKSAYLALDRLTISHPEDVLNNLYNNPGLLSERTGTRSDLFARADPGSPTQARLIEDYLLSSETSPPEKTGFLEKFPNMNQTLSHNLMTESVPFEHGMIQQRLNDALQLIGQWQQTPEFDSLSTELEEAAEMLRRRGAQIQ